jgi:general secretion pathway protein G
LIIKLSLLLAIALLLQGCVSQTELAKDTLESGIYSDNAVTYRNIETYPGRVVCGEFTTRRTIREIDYKLFIFHAEKIIKQPTAEDLAVFCSLTPLKGLYTVSGINFSGESKTNLLQIRTDFSVLDTSLKQYQSDNVWVPKTNQGLKALVQPSDIAPKPRAFREGGYIGQIPIDPWGRPYIYAGPMYAGVQGQYKLTTLGADGEVGGTDSNADIGAHHVKYLNHIEEVE